MARPWLANTARHRCVVEKKVSRAHRKKEPAVSVRSREAFVRGRVVASRVGYRFDDGKKSAQILNRASFPLQGRMRRT